MLYFEGSCVNPISLNQKYLPDYDFKWFLSLSLTRFHSKRPVLDANCLSF